MVCLRHTGLFCEEHWVDSMVHSWLQTPPLLQFSKQRFHFFHNNMSTSSVEVNGFINRSITAFILGLTFMCIFLLLLLDMAPNALLSVSKHIYQFLWRCFLYASRLSRLCAVQIYLQKAVQSCWKEILCQWGCCFCSLTLEFIFSIHTFVYRAVASLWMPFSLQITRYWVTLEMWGGFKWCNSCFTSLTWYILY